MTQREFLNKVIATPNIAEDIKAEAEALIAKLDTKNEQRKGKQTKVQKENEPIAKAIVEYLTDKGEVLGVDIASALNLTVSKLNGVAGNLWKEGVLVKGKAKVKGKGEMTTYALAPTDEGEGEGESAED
jgi:single-stranded DNA-specific DHH superfamily exonuclease